MCCLLIRLARTLSIHLHCAQVRMLAPRHLRTYSRSFNVTCVQFSATGEALATYNNEVRWW
jgi:hypothetical protein